MKLNKKMSQFRTLYNFIIFVIISTAAIESFSDELTDQLVQKFKSRVSLLDRETVTFRYETKNQFEPQNLDEVRGRIRGWPERFLDAKIVTYDVAGPGTYLAIDPFISRGFGNMNPQLYILTLKKGIITLDLNKSLEPDQKEIIKKIHNQFQCKIKNGEIESIIEEAQMDLFSLRRSSTESCRQAAIDVIKALNIQAIFYSYGASNSLEGCRDKYVAINAISSHVFDFQKTAFFSDEHAIGSIESGGLIKKIYDEASQDFNLLLSSDLSQDLPKQLEKMTLPDHAEYTKWKSEKIYFCGEKWSTEVNPKDDVTTKLMTNLKLNFTDKEIEKSILNLKKLYSVKAAGKGYFNLSNLVKIDKLNFKASGLSQDDETFKQWAYLSRTSYESAENKKKLYRLYGIEKGIEESVNDVAKIEEIMSHMSEQQLLSPDLYLKIMQHFGFVGGYVLVTLNQMNMYKGGIILSMIDDKKSMSENIQINKENYLNALQECAVIYADEKMTFEDIQKTDCEIKNSWQP